MPPKSTRKVKPGNDDENGGGTESDNDVDISLKDLYKLMQSIKMDTESTAKKLDSIEVRVSNLETRSDKADGTTLEMQSDIESLKDTVSLISGRLRRSETVNRRLEHELSDLKARSMNKNIIFTFNKDGDFGKESPNENCVDIIGTFLSNVMKVQNPECIMISVAHRLGKFTSGKLRPIIASFPHATDINSIFSKVGSLKGSGHFIAKQLPPDQTERKQFAAKEFNDKRKLPDIKSKMVGGTLYINGSIQRQFLPPSVTRDITSLPDDISISDGDEIHDEGSDFRGFVADVTSLSDVGQALDVLVRRQEVASATHVIYAYRIQTSSGGDVIENFDSDGDYGVGLQLLKAMQRQTVVNKLLVATRTCGPNYAHIGQRRFEHVKDVCFSALK